MQIFLYIFFATLSYYGFLGILLPQEQRRITWSTLKILPFKVWAIIAGIIGYFLFQTAEFFAAAWIIYFLSVLIFIDAVLLFFVPGKKIKEMVRFWLLLPNNAIKLISFFYLLMAVSLFLFFQKSF